MEIILGFIGLVFAFYIWDSLAKIKKNQALIMKHLGIDPQDHNNNKKR